MVTQTTLMGRYQLGRLLGSGGMGAVYLAEDTRLRREVAIKVCSVQGLPPADAADAAALFQSEALTLARLRHPGLTAVWDYFNDGDDWYLVMEYVPGTTLRDRLAHVGGRLPLAQMLDYAGQLCDVLNYLHTQTPPVVFRDLKPANIMLTPDGSLKLIDFGIARLFSPGKQADTAQFGTPGYAPPEQYGGQTEPRSDVYSLGVVLHHMVTGHQPQGHVFDVPLARTLDPTIPPGVEMVLAKATAYAPADRFPTAADFCVALRRAVPVQNQRNTVPVHAPPVYSPNPPTSDASRPLWTPAKTRPTRPEAAGTGRGLVLVLLLFALFGSVTAGGWVLRGRLAGLGLSIGGPASPSPNAPVFSVPGTLIYVAPGRNGSEQVWRRTGTLPPEQITQIPDGMNAALPALSPNGKQLAYTLDRGNGQQLWLLTIASNQTRQLLGQYPIVRAPAWSPDGRRLAVEVANEKMAKAGRDRDIVIVEVDTGVQTVLVDTKHWEGGPTWSPDGKEIAFHARLEACMLLYVVAAEGGTPRQLTQLPNETDCTGGNGDYWADWSPDGTALAFGRKVGSVQQVALYTFATNRTDAYQTGDEPAGYPRWSPDGTALIFEEGRLPATHLARMNLATRVIETLADTTGAHLPDWR